MWLWSKRSLHSSRPAAPSLSLSRAESASVSIASWSPATSFGGRRMPVAAFTTSFGHAIDVMFRLTMLDQDDSVHYVFLQPLSACSPNHALARSRNSLGVQVFTAPCDSMSAAVIAATRYG